MTAPAAGIHAGIPEDVYHADPCAAPSLSASIAKLLIGRSPMHAKHAHPRLTAVAREDREADRKMDIGSAAHALVLGAGAALEKIDADNYLTKAAKEARDKARSEGRTPILRGDMLTVQAMVGAAGEQLRGMGLAGAFDGGTPEATLIWRDGGAWCRSRVDFLPDAVRAGGHVRVFDYKTTAGSAAPADFARTAFDMGYEVQAAFYERGLMALIPEIRSVEFVFVAQEQEPPYALSAVTLDNMALDYARGQVAAAIRLWARCLATDDWPGYARRLVTIDTPTWRAERGEFARDAMIDRLREAA